MAFKYLMQVQEEPDGEPREPTVKELFDAVHERLSHKVSELNAADHPKATAEAMLAKQHVEDATVRYLAARKREEGGFDEPGPDPDK